MALQQYADVLTRDAANKAALAGMTALTMESRQWSDAHRWATRLTEVDANDKTAWYTLGVVDWTSPTPS